MDPAGYDASFLEGSAQQWLIESYLSGLMEDILLLGRSYERRYKKPLPSNTRINTIDSVWSGRGKVATSKILSMSLTADA